MYMAAHSRLSTDLLTGVAETLLIPLVARADAHRRYPHLRFRDVYSERILERLDCDPERFRTDRGSMLGSCLRARWMEDQAVAFLRKYPNALCISLGAGLDTLHMRVCDRLGDFDGHWCDIDVPEVIALKRRLLTEVGSYRLLGADLLDAKWIDELPWQAGRPVLFVAEGVFMYWQRAEVEALLQRILQAASWRRSPTSILFDWCSPFMAKQSHRQPSVRRTRAAADGERPFKWSIDHPSELLWLHPSLELRSTFDIMRECSVGARFLGWLHRRLTGRLFYGCSHLVFRPWL